MKTVTMQNDFSSGELSPRLLARVDVAAYDKAVKTMENAISLTHGGCTRRPGTFYIGEIANSNQAARLIPFVYSKSSSYVLVFNNNKIEFIRNGSFILSGTAHYSISSPYPEADLKDIRFAQQGNVIFFAHPSYPPKMLVRYSDTNWVLSDISFIYRAVTDYAYDNAYVRFQIVGGGTAFAAGDKFTLVSNGTIVTSITPGTNVGNGTIVAPIVWPGAPAETWTVTCAFATKDRQEWNVVGSISGTMVAKWSAGDYPAAVSFYEQRLFFAGSKSRPQTIWGSASDDYSTFTLGTKDNDAISFTIASNRFDQLVHLEAARQLLPFSYGGEFTMAGATGGITPTAVRIRSQTSHGTNWVQPMKIGQEVLFMQRDGKKLRAISYSVTEDANVAPDITIFSEHITQSGVIDMTFSQNPNYVAWLVRADGVLLSLTHLREQAITAWARHITDGRFEAVATVPEVYSDTTYCVVQRTVNGVTKRFIETIDYIYDSMMDCTSFGYDGVAKMVWTGLDHLEGKTVAVVADGQVHPNVVVTGGSITMQYAANEVQVGIPYTTTIELLHPSVTGKDGTNQGRAISVNEIILRAQDSIGCKVNGVVVPFRLVGDKLDTPLAPFTGDKKIGSRGWTSPLNISIVQDSPLPFTLLGVILKVSIEE